ncbi:hypothetical protein AVEN_30421-1 [Araneus ventricosus]|uniref:Uncharacterized protein n=1 Tax=Araneus ventricosus TaxID=182803 RepID=A0A4Y2NTA0_ARAVE|nr:hypothetical protein AVEN_30421-1 [Araneus ventricosus]
MLKFMYLARCFSSYHLDIPVTDRTPPHVLVPATITVAIPVGWTTCPMSLFLQPLQLPYQLDGQLAPCPCSCNHYSCHTSWMDNLLTDSPPDDG